MTEKSFAHKIYMETYAPNNRDKLNSYARAYSKRPYVKARRNANRRSQRVGAE